MALKAILESLEGLPAEVAEHYIEVDGSFRLDVTPTGGFSLADVNKLQKALNAEREANKQARAELKKFEGIDDPDAAREALGKLEELANFDPEEKLKAAKQEFEQQLTRKFESDRQKIVQEANSKVEKLTIRSNKLAERLGNELLQAQAAKACAEHGGNPTLLIPFLKTQTRARFDEEKDDFVIDVLGDDGQPRTSSKAGDFSTPMKLAELVEEMSKDDKFAPLFNASGASGGGAGGNSGSARSGGGVFRISEAQARDPVQYRAAKDAAAKAGQELQIG